MKLGSIYKFSPWLSGQRPELFSKLQQPVGNNSNFLFCLGQLHLVVRRVDINRLEFLMEDVLSRCCLRIKILFHDTSYKSEERDDLNEIFYAYYNKKR